VDCFNGCIPAAVEDEVGISAEETRGVSAQRNVLAPLGDVAFYEFIRFFSRPSVLHCLLP
jgi:hypothetical protein